MKSGVFGVYFMLISVGAFFMFPSKSIKCGDLDENDYLNFPRWLLNLMKFLYVVGLGGGLAMFVLFFGGKYMGWIESFCLIGAKNGFRNFIYDLFSRAGRV
ncbi:hypothetical protein VC33_08025 [Pseudomonas fluorescens]|nr:hypothetical protein VC33_08025 [Pseudomonas fluorescens]